MLKGPGSRRRAALTRARKRAPANGGTEESANRRPTRRFSGSAGGGRQRRSGPRDACAPDVDREDAAQRQPARAPRRAVDVAVTAAALPPTAVVRVNAAPRLAERRR